MTWQDYLKIVAVVCSVIIAAILIVGITSSDDDEEIVPCDDCDFAMNGRMAVIGVDRSDDQTCITYLNGEWEPSEWWAACSMEKHMEFLERFRKMHKRGDAL